MQPAQGSVKFGAKLVLTATVTVGEPQNLRWVVFNCGSGKVEFDLGDPTKATYTAPASTTHVDHSSPASSASLPNKADPGHLLTSKYFL